MKSFDYSKVDYNFFFDLFEILFCDVGKTQSRMLKAGKQFFFVIKLNHIKSSDNKKKLKPRIRRMSIK